MIYPAYEGLASVPTRVLLVDDQMIFAELIRRMLVNQENVEFYYTSDPHKAVETAVDVDATAILLDLNMPGASGFEVLNWLRADNRTQQIPVLMLSSEDKPEIKLKAFTCQANDYLVKNPEQVEMLARLRAHSRAYQNTLALNASILENQALAEKLAAANIQLQATNIDLQQQSTTDALTNIANRRKFDSFLSAAIKKLHRGQDHLSLLILDVDFFKKFNDYYGHQKGDECLQALGALLQKHIHRHTDLPARYGGEEFAVILPGTDAYGARTIALQLCKAVHDLAIPHRKSDMADHVTISIGITSVTGPGEFDAATLIEAADNHLYSAKQKGRNQVCCSLPATVHEP